MKFAVPAAVSALIGALLGLGTTLLISVAGAQNTRPELNRGDAATSLLNNVDYGSR